MTEPGLVRAPFDERQVRSLSACQRADGIEPLACPSPMCGAVLVVRAHGLACPSPMCGYSQEWAPAWRADDSWREGSQAG